MQPRYDEAACNMADAVIKVGTVSPIPRSEHLQITNGSITNISAIKRATKYLKLKIKIQIFLAGVPK